MGERTQLFINVENKRGQQILGTVVHYQSGIGSTMLLSALNIAINIDHYVSEWDFKVIDPTTPVDDYLNSIDNLYALISSKCDLLNGCVAKKLRENIKENIGGSGFLNQDVSKIEDPFFNIKNVKNKEITKEEIVSLNRTYAAKYNDFYNQCDNDDGFMIMNIIYDHDEQIDKYNWIFADPEKIEFGFANECHIPIDIDDYVKLFINKDMINQKFIVGYKQLVQSFNIHFLSARALKARMAN